MLLHAALAGGNVASRRGRCCGAWMGVAVALVAACGGAADDGEQLEPPVTSPPRPPVVAIEPRPPVVTAPDAPAIAPAPDVGEGEPSGSAFDPIEWSSLPPPGAYDSAFPFPRDGTPEQQRRWLRGEAETVLLAYCGQCHGPRSAFEVRGDFGDINDFDAIVAQGQLIPCDARSSPVLQRMLDRSMPPPGGDPVRAADIAIVRDATDFGCASR